MKRVMQFMQPPQTEHQQDSCGGYCRYDNFSTQIIMYNNSNIVMLVMLY